MYDPLEHHNTNEHYSPHDLLPAPEPKTYSPPEGYFYHNVAKHLVKDTVRIMMNGLHIDLDKVEELESTLDDQLAEVAVRLATNPLINQFQELQHKSLVKEYIEDRKSKLRSVDYYLKPFKPSDMVHRSYFMHFFAESQGLPSPSELLPGSSVSKWPANLVKTFSKSRPVLQRLLSGELTSHPLIDKAMLQLAQDKCDIYNQKYLEAIQSPNVPVPAFNPASSVQKQKLFAWLGFESNKTSKETGLPSWDRDEIEIVNKSTVDDDIRDLTQAFIDHSFAAIVRNNFIEAFYRYTVENRLHGQYKLLGAKSGRYTSSNPNMLNSPSTKSIFSKPIKRCFTAPKGFVIGAVDYAALEDRVIASLSRDENKCNIFLQNLDGHCLNAYGYFRERVAAEMSLTGDTVADVKQFYAMSETNKVLKDIRQDGKPATFGLSYGAYPPKVAATLKIPLPDAEQIFDRYHNVLYPGITDYRENYVLSTAQANGRIHLGLGFYMKTDNPRRDIRTLNNGTCQFWSTLTALTINKMHQLIDEAGYQHDILVTSTIYDSIYFEIRKDPHYIKWTNDNLIPIMTTDFMENQTIKNEADLEIGTSWADLHKLPHNASLEEIQSILESL